ncbi:MAG: (Fe-S)-binding protein [Proteobacteria bacterium]|nr:(Fe-S)-binding protein [Pseudomonadota bacterium]
MEKKLLSEFSKKLIIEESNQCVSCGLCLPHCPTYRVLQSEADSPRGRIALMSGVATGHIPLNARFVQHMDRCLTCRACEAVCPNSVTYGRLIDEARALIADHSTSTATVRKSHTRMVLERLLLAQPMRLDRLRWGFYFMQKRMPLQWLQKSILGKKSKLLKFIMQLPLVKFPYAMTAGGNNAIGNFWQAIYPAQGEKCGEVALFLGCVARITDVETLNSSIYVLNRLGYTVHVPPAQTCCGAIHQHSGDPEQANALVRRNRSVFAGFDAVISTSSGCGVQLIESGVADNQARITDISHFLMKAEGWENVDMAPLAEKILVHEPCSLRNVLHDQAYPYQLIARIPGVEAVPLAGNDQCCGAAGTYFIDQPEIADMLLSDKIAALKESGVQYLVTSNIGCAMHMANGLYEQGINVEVLHPVALLARQMGLKL